MDHIKQQKIDELLTRGVNEIIDFVNLKKKILSKKRLRVKLGIDPSSPNIHLGNLVCLLKLRQFQQLGHKIVFIIGDATGMIGDTSDKQSERPALTKKQVQQNFQTYIQQVAKILDIKKTEVYFNSQWLDSLGYQEIGKQANIFSLAQFIARDNIKQRLKKGQRISLREILYPLMQGYDSVVVRADVEVGGTDQRFNALAGRKMQEYYKQAPQDILMLNLINGLDNRKMSKSFNNTINILDKPNNIFGKTMTLEDNLIIVYFEHCTTVEMIKINQFKNQLKNKKINPRDLKMKLGYELVKLCWGERQAVQAQDYFVSTFQRKKIPTDIKIFKPVSYFLVDVLIEIGLVQSKQEVKRLIKQGGIKINNKIIKTIDIKVNKGDIIQKGKLNFIKIL